MQSHQFLYGFYLPRYPHSFPVVPCLEAPGEEIPRLKPARSHGPPTAASSEPQIGFHVLATPTIAVFSLNCRIIAHPDSETNRRSPERSRKVASPCVPARSAAPRSQRGVIAPFMCPWSLTLCESSPRARISVSASPFMRGGVRRWQKH